MEPMAVESILAALWELQGFLTKSRVAYPVNNGYSDIDVIGLKGDTLRIGECKARYRPNTVMVVTEDIENFYTDWLGSWGKFSTNLDKFWEAEYEWLPNKKDLQSVELWFCGNIFFQNDAVLKKAKTTFFESIKNKLPHGIKNKTTIELISTFDAILRTTEELKYWIEKEGWGKRFGNPIIDTLRELNRYLNCKHTEGGAAIIKSEDIRAQSIKNFNKLFGTK